MEERRRKQTVRAASSQLAWKEEEGHVAKNKGIPLILAIKKLPMPYI